MISQWRTWMKEYIAIAFWNDCCYGFKSWYCIWKADRYLHREGIWSLEWKRTSPKQEMKMDLKDKERKQRMAARRWSQILEFSLSKGQSRLRSLKNWQPLGNSVTNCAPRIEKTMIACNIFSLGNGRRPPKPAVFRGSLSQAAQRKRKVGKPLQMDDLAINVP